MFQPPPEFSALISVFSPLFSKKIFERAGQLLLGAILTQGTRTVCGVLRTLGLKNTHRWDLSLPQAMRTVVFEGSLRDKNDFYKIVFVPQNPSVK